MMGAVMACDQSRPDLILIDLRYCSGKVRFKLIDPRLGARPANGELFSDLATFWISPNTAPGMIIAWLPLSSLAKLNMGRVI
jgi:hypothetical protein